MLNITTNSIWMEKTAGSKTYMVQAVEDGWVKAVPFGWGDAKRDSMIAHNIVFQGLHSCIASGRESMLERGVISASRSGGTTL